MYQVVDSTGKVLATNLKSKREAKEIRNTYPEGTAFTQRMDSHPKGASHLPEPKRVSFKTMVQAETTDEVGVPAGPVAPLTDEEIEAEVRKYPAHQTMSGMMPIWMQKPTAKSPLQISDFGDDEDDLGFHIESAPVAQAQA